MAILPMGRCLVEQDQMVTGLPPGLWWNQPVRSYLIRTVDGLFLFDTGMPGRLSHDLWALLGEGDARTSVNSTGDPEPAPETVDSLVPVVREVDHLASRLQAAGLRPEDLDGVITSHWHFDHAGGLDAVAGRPILAAQREIESVFPSGEPAGPIAAVPPEPVPFWLQGEVRLRPVVGDEVLSPGVTILATPGHTPGHQSLLVETGQGAFLLTSDAVYTHVNWDTDTPGYLADPEEGRRSVARLRQIAQDTGATVLFGHDAEQGRVFRTFPHWYR